MFSYSYLRAVLFSVISIFYSYFFPFRNLSLVICCPGAFRLGNFYSGITLFSLEILVGLGNTGQFGKKRSTSLKLKELYIFLRHAPRLCRKSSDLVDFWKKSHFSCFFCFKRRQNAHFGKEALEWRKIKRISQKITFPAFFALKGAKMPNLGKKARNVEKSG